MPDGKSGGAAGKQVTMPTIRQPIVAALTRRYPLYSGCGTLANHRLVQWLAGRSSDIAWVRVYGGKLVAAPLDDYVGRAVYFTRELDRKITWICARVVRRGDTVLDIGANIGLVTFVLASLVGETGHVHAFEPIPRLQKLIEQAIRKNGASNVTLHRVALGSENGNLELTIPKGNLGQASLAPVRTSPHAEKISVPVVRLSSLLTPDTVGTIRLAKIDVEGFEPEVLKGAADLISKTPPDTILFELNKSDGSVRKHPTIRILSEMGYGFFSIPRCLFRMRIRQFDPTVRTDDPPGHDFLAARKGKIFAEVARRINAKPAD